MEETRRTSCARLSRKLSLAALLLVVPVLPTASSAASPPPAYQRAFSTWIPYWDATNSLRDVLAHARLVRFASPFWYSATSARTITREPGAGDRSVVDALRSHGIAVVPTVTEAWTAPQAASILESPRSRRAHVAALVAVARRYDGIDLDYEQMAVTTNRMLADRIGAAFTKTVVSLCAKLDTLHKSCDITVMARTTDSHVVWRRRLATWEYDYRAIGRSATRMRIMAYAQHGPHEQPGPLAPSRWIKAILAYATSTTAPSKVELALPFYGYDWSGRGVSPVSYHQADQLRRLHHRPYTYSTQGGSPHFGYTDGAGYKHTVWYEDHRSLRVELALAARYRVGSVGSWYAGLEDPADWAVARNYARR